MSQVCKLPNFILYYLVIKIVVSYVAALVKPLFFVFGGLYWIYCRELAYMIRGQLGQTISKGRLELSGN